MIPCCVPFTSKLSGIQPSERENNILDTSRPMVPGDRLLRSYIVWRKAALIFLCPLLIIETALSIFAFQHELEVLNTIKLTNIGWICKISQYALSPIIQSIGAFWAFFKWTEIKVSQKIFNSAIAISLILSFWPAFPPIESIYSESERNEDLRTFYENEINWKNAFGIWLPLFLAIPNGSVRGGMNVMGLINDSSVPGCIVLLLTPFSVLIHLSVYTFVMRSYASLTLGLGLLFMILAKLKAFFYAKFYLYGDVKSIGEKKIGLIGSVLSIASYTCLAIWAGTTKYDKETTVLQKIEQSLREKTWPDYALMLHGYFTKACIYALIFTDMVLHMTLICEGDRQWSCRGMSNYFY